MHYRRTWFGGWKAEADGQDFYVAADGKTNPKGELLATLAAFYSRQKRTPTEKFAPPQTVRCQFPARWHWLSKELKLAEVAAPAECSEFESFKTRVAARSATMVFSSFHVNNPSSAFGHSLIRLNKSAQAEAEEHHQLLDYGVNYAANPTTSNPVLYAIYGFVGGFPGTFTNLPYYYKVREYNDFESRDLWEYDLNLEPEEINMLIAHTWELGSARFNYFYLDENCSYHMLTLLEAAAPRLNLLRHMPFWVLPSDTIKATVAEAGLVRAIHFRPSIYTQFQTRLARLQTDEVDQFQKLIETDGATATSEKTTANDSEDRVSQARVLDTYIDYVDMKHAHALLEKDAKVTALKQSILLARSRLPVTEPLAVQVATSEAPQFSHGSTRLHLQRAESDANGGATGLAIRFALHDQLDPRRALPVDSEVEFMNTLARWWDRDKRLRLEDFAFLGISTYQPLSRFHRKLSWRFRMGAERIDDPRCANCVAGFIRGGAGATVGLLGGNRLVSYALLEGALHGSSGFRDEPFTFALGPTVGVRISLPRDLALLTEGYYRRSVNSPIFEERRLRATLRFAPTIAWAIEANASWGRFDREVVAGLYHYF